MHVKKINQENDGNSKRGADQVGSPRLLGGVPEARAQPVGRSLCDVTAPLAGRMVAMAT